MFAELINLHKVILKECDYKKEINLQHANISIIILKACLIVKNIQICMYDLLRILR
jgi:hypothetical protein